MPGGIATVLRGCCRSFDGVLWIGYTLPFPARRTRTALGARTRDPGPNRTTHHADAGGGHTADQRPHRPRGRPCGRCRRFREVAPADEGHDILVQGDAIAGIAGAEQLARPEGQDRSLVGHVPGRPERGRVGRGCDPDVAAQSGWPVDRTHRRGCPPRPSPRGSLRGRRRTARSGPSHRPRLVEMQVSSRTSGSDCLNMSLFGPPVNLRLPRATRRPAFRLSTCVCRFIRVSLADRRTGAFPESQRHLGLHLVSSMTKAEGLS